MELHGKIANNLDKIIAFAVKTLSFHVKAMR